MANIGLSLAISGIVFCMGAMNGKASVVLDAPEQIDAHEQKSIFLAAAPLDIFKQIVLKLSVRDLASLEQTSKALQPQSSSNEVWKTVYDREKLCLFPFLKGQVLFDALSPELVASYKQALGLLMVLRRPFLKLESPCYPLLKRLTEQALREDCIYRDIILYMISDVQQDLPAQRKHGRNILYSEPHKLCEHLYRGQGDFQNVPKSERFNLLREYAANKTPSANGYLLAALIEGNLDERPAKERWADLYQFALSGEEKVLVRVVESLKKGELLGERHSYEDCLEQLDQRIKHPFVQNAMAEFYYNPSFSEISLSEEERFQRLKASALKGNSQAAHCVDDCLQSGALGVNGWGDEERFNVLKHMWEQNLCQDLFPLFKFSFSLADIITHGKWGQGRYSVQERLKWLEDLAFQENQQGYKYLGSYLVNLICEGKALGLEQLTPQDKIARIEELAQRGLIAAQEHVVKRVKWRSLYTPKYAEHNSLSLALSEEEKLERLKRYHKQGYAKALEAWIEILYFGNSKINEMSPKSRYRKLKKYAKDNKKAQEYLASVEKIGGFTKKSGRRDHMFDQVRFELKGLTGRDSFFHETEIDFPLPEALLREILEEKAAKGDQTAQEWLYQALYEGKFGYQEHPVQARFSQLLEEASQGKASAIRYVVKALATGVLGQNKISQQKRFKHIESWALKGNPDAIRTLIEIVNSEQWPPEMRESIQRFAYFESLMKQGLLEAGEQVCAMLISGFGLPLSKAERRNKLIRLSEEGYEQAQKKLVELIWNETPSWNLLPEETLKASNFGTKDERMQTLIQFGDKYNPPARSAVKRTISNLLSTKLTRQTDISDQAKQIRIGVIYEWFAQGDLECKLFCYTENPQGIFKTIANLQSFYDIYALFVPYSQELLDRKFQNIIDNTNLL